MKKDKIIYWVSTSFIFVGLALPAIMFNSEMSKAAMAHYGFPYYFGVELGLAKFIGGFALILPFVPKRIKEFAYFGFGIDFISAFIAISVVDGIGAAYLPIMAIILLKVSYIYYHKLQGESISSLYK